MSVDIETLPPLETEPKSEPERDEEAPYGYKADGTPRRKPGRPAGSGGGNRTAKDDVFAREIEAELHELFAPVALASPLAYWHVGQRAERTSKACVILAKKHPQFRAAIVAYFASVAYKDVALFIAGIPIAFMIDLGMLKPDAVAGRIFRMQEGWEELYGEDGSEFPEQNMNGNTGARGLAGQL